MVGARLWRRIALWIFLNLLVVEVVVLAPSVLRQAHRLGGQGPGGVLQGSAGCCARPAGAGPAHHTSGQAWFIAVNRPARLAEIQAGSWPVLRRVSV